MTDDHPQPLAIDRLPSLSDTIREARLAADKRLGQHFLTDPGILRRIAQAAGARADVTAIEIGPGPGGLTRELLRTGAQVVAIERDQRCSAVLAPLLDASQGRLRLIEADALTVDLEPLICQPTVICANLPYNIASELIVRWLSQRLPVRSMTVLVQKEVGARLQARPGTAVYGRLAILAQWTAEVEGLFDLPPGAFKPPPKVHSRLIRLAPKAELPEDVPLKVLSRVTAAAFGQRRKMLKTSLKGITRDPTGLLQACGIDPDDRPERLPVSAFAELTRRLAKAG